MKRSIIGLITVSLVVVACSGGNNEEQGNIGVEDVMSDGVITDGELERTWLQVEECLKDKGIDAKATILQDEWGVEISGEFPERAYDSCAELGEKVSLAYWRERIPEGAARLELAESLRSCLAEVGVTEMPFGPETVRANEIMVSAIAQLGYEEASEPDGDPSVVDALMNDPRFGQVLDCLTSHQLLFSARFGEAGE